jgi:hypothetical protein
MEKIKKIEASKKEEGKEKKQEEKEKKGEEGEKEEDGDEKINFEDFMELEKQYELLIQITQYKEEKMKEMIAAVCDMWLFVITIFVIVSIIAIIVVTFISQLLFPLQFKSIPTFLFLTFFSCRGRYLKFSHLFVSSFNLCSLVVM